MGYSDWVVSHDTRLVARLLRVAGVVRGPVDVAVTVGVFVAGFAVGGRAGVAVVAAGYLVVLAVGYVLQWAVARTGRRTLGRGSCRA